MSPKFGPAQQAVLKWLSDKESATAGEVGDALYESICGLGYLDRDTDLALVRASWARRVLNYLIRNGKVERVTHRKPIKYAAR